MEVAAGRKPPPGPRPGATAAAPLPRSKLPTFRPLPLVHSGISGDLDGLLVKVRVRARARVRLRLRVRVGVRVRVRVK